MRGRGFRVGALVLGATVLAGCTATRAPRGGAASGLNAPIPAPEWLGGVSMIEGDLLIVRSADFTGTLSARHLAQDGFEHSLLLTRDAGGRPALLHAHRRGVETRPYPDYLNFHARAIVLRRQSADETGVAKRLGDAARGWMYRPDRRAFRFRFEATDESVAEGTISCVSLLNNVYRDAGFPPPFVRAAPRPDNRWMRMAHLLIGFDFSNQPAPADLLDNAEYRILAEGWNPATDASRMAAMDALTDAIHDMAMDGWQLRRPRISVRILARIYRHNGRFVETTSWTIEARAALFDFAARVERALDDHLLRNRNTTETEAARLTRDYAHRLRDRYFERAPDALP